MSHERCRILERTAGRTGIPNFTLRVRPCSGERLWVDMSTVVWQNRRNQHLLATHLAHDIARQKRTEPATEKTLQMCRQFNKIAEETVPAEAPVSALSEQEPHILRPFSSGKNSAVDTQAITGGL